MIDLSDEEQRAWELLKGLRASAEGVKKQWPWFCAVWAFDYDDPKPLSKLIRTQPIPDELRDLIADIVLGKRKPQKKAAVKAKIPAAQRGSVFYEHMQAKFACDLVSVLTMKTFENDPFFRRHPMESIDVKRSMESLRRAELEKLPSAYDAKLPVIDAIRREGIDRVNKWPKV